MSELHGKKAAARPRAIEVSDATVERALGRILELEKPFFRPAGTLMHPSVGRRVGHEPTAS